MATLTIRKLDDEVMEQFKEIARRHNRSAEAEARSLLEEFTAEHIARYEVEHHNFFDRIRAFMEEEGVTGFDENELPILDRQKEQERPNIDWK